MRDQVKVCNLPTNHNRKEEYNMKSQYMSLDNCSIGSDGDKECGKEE